MALPSVKSSPNRDGWLATGRAETAVRAERRRNDFCLSTRTGNRGGGTGRHQELAGAVPPAALHQQTLAGRTEPVRRRPVLASVDVGALQVV